MKAQDFYLPCSSVSMTESLVIENVFNLEIILEILGYTDGFINERIKSSEQGLIITVKVIKELTS